MNGASSLNGPVKRTYNEAGFDRENQQYAANYQQNNKMQPPPL